jgi:hypothetical protein
MGRYVSEPVQLFCQIIVECDRVAVLHRVPRSAGRNSHSDTIATPHRYVEDYGFREGLST